MKQSALHQLSLTLCDTTEEKTSNGLIDGPHFFFLVDQIDLVSQRHIVFDLNVSLFVCKKKYEN